MGSGLGVSALPNPTVITPEASSTPLPSGASGITCLYESLTSATPLVVVVGLASGLPSDWYQNEEQQEVSQEKADGISINFQPLSGLGDEAATYTYTAAGATVEGCVAEQGGNFVGVFTDGTTATLSQIESLVRSLL